MKNNLDIFKTIFFIKGFIKPTWMIFKESNLSNIKIYLVLVLTVLPSFFEATFIFSVPNTPYLGKLNM